MSGIRFYQFLGAHSFLIGLLPFFIPVYLWRTGFGLAHLSVLIGVSGLTFCVALGAWQRFAKTWPLPRLLGLSFVLELVLIGLLVQLSSSPLSLIALAIANGLYNAFFWTTQRTLFISLTEHNNTGREYGNFQILVTVFLKFGLLAGGLLLDAGGIHWLMLLSAVVGLLGTVWMYKVLSADPLAEFTDVSLTKSLRFTDEHQSRRIFVIDGLFLYLESHFWTLSLFLLVKEDYSALGLTVIALALVFSALFYAIKNTIDKYSGATIYSLAVGLYAISWLLRAVINPDTSLQWILVALVLITFCSSFFRLAFNKRFFDIAKKSSGTEYLLVKSYVSQFILGISFLVLAAVFLAWPAEIGFTSVYLIATFLAVLYVGYGARGLQKH